MPFAPISLHALLRIAARVRRAVRGPHAGVRSMWFSPGRLFIAFLLFTTGLLGPTDLAFAISTGCSYINNHQSDFTTAISPVTSANNNTAFTIPGSGTFAAGDTIAATGTVTGTGALTMQILDQLGYNNTNFGTPASDATNTTQTWSYIVSTADATQTDPSSVYFILQGGSYTSSNNYSINVTSISCTPASSTSAPTASSYFGATAGSTTAQTIAVGGNTTTLNIKLTNPNAGTDLTGVTLAQNATALSGVSASAGSATCTASSTPGTVTISSGKISIGSFTLKANDTCTFPITLTGSSTRSAFSFTPGTVSATGPSSLNSSPGASTNTLSVVAAPTITGVNGSASAYVTAGATHSVTINGTGFVSGDSYTVTIGGTAATGVSYASATSLTATVPSKSSGSYAVAVTDTTLGASASGSVTLNYASPPSISAALGSSSIAQNGTTTLTLTLNNPNSFALSNVAVSSIALSSGVQIAATPGLSNSCGGTVSGATSGSTSLSLSGGSLGSSGSCTIQVTIVGTSAGSNINVPSSGGTPSATESGSGTAVTAAQLTVSTTPVLAVAMTHSGNAAKGSTFAYTITPSNTGTGATTSATLTATWSLPTGLTYSAASGTGWTCTSTSCTSTTPIAAAGTGNAITLTVTVGSNAASTVTPSVTLSGGGAAASATGSDSGTTVGNASAPTVSAGFSPASIGLAAGTSTLTVTFTNPNAFALSAASGSATLSSTNLVGTSVGGTCANPSFTQGTGTLSFSAGSFTASGSCTLTLSVSSATATTYSVASASVTTAESGTSAPSVTAGTGGNALTVNAPVLAPTIAHAGNAVKGSTLTYTLTPNVTVAATTSATLTATWTLPAGWTYSSASGTGWTCASSGCTTTTPMAIGTGNTISLTVTVPSNATSTTTTPTVTMAGGGAASVTSAADPTTVTAAPAPTVSLALAPASIAAGGTSVATITLANTASGTIALTGVADTVTLPSGVVIAATPAASTTCGSGSVSATANGSSIALSGATLAAGASCTFQASITAASASGSPYTIPTGTPSATESAAGTAGPAVALTVTAATPATVAVSAGSGQSAAISTAFATNLAVLVKDAYGNVVPNTTVTFTAPSSGASGTFAGATATATVTTNAAGIATAPVFTANTTAGGPYAVTASVAGGAAPASFSLTNSVGIPASIAVVDGNNQVATVATAFGTALSVVVKDAGGNVVSGATVTFAAPSSGPSGAFAGSPTVATNASGLATAPGFTANTQPGTYTVTASVAGVTTPASFSLTNQAGAPSTPVITGGNNQSTSVSTPFGTQLSVSVTDSAGNPLANVNVTFTAPTSGPSGTFTVASQRADVTQPSYRQRITAATFLPSGSVQLAAAGGGTSITVPTNAQGVASVNFVANGSTGSYAVTASISGGGAVTFSLANVKATNTITFNPIAGVLQGSGPVALVATATSGDTVIFTSLTPAVCTVSGSTATLVKGASGTCTIAANDPGNATYAAATQVTQSFQINLRPDPSKDPEVIGLITAQTQAAKQFADVQIHNFNSRLEQMHGDGYVPDSFGLSLSDGTQQDPDELKSFAEADPLLKRSNDGQSATNRALAKADRERETRTKSAVDRERAAALDRAFAFWTAGAIQVGRIHNNNTVSPTDLTTSGISVGVDYRLSQFLSIGFGLGYGVTTAEIGNNGTKTTGRNYDAVLYSSLRPTPASFIDIVAGAGLLDFTSNRFITGGFGSARGKRTGYEFFGSITTGVDFKTKQYTLTPYVRLEGKTGTLNAFDENAPTPWALHYDKETFSTASVDIGIKAKLKLKNELEFVQPFFRAEYQHDIINTATAGVTYADLVGTGTTYTVALPGSNANRIMLGLGADMTIDDFKFTLEYLNAFSTSSSSDASMIRAKVTKQF